MPAARLAPQTIKCVTGPKGSSLRSHLAGKKGSRPSLLVRNEKAVFGGELAVGLRRTEGVGVVVEFEVVIDDIFSGGNRDERFPAVGHQQSEPHGIEIVADNDIGL